MSKAYSEGRKFATGATRDTADDKPDFEGCLSPLVLESFAHYMVRSSYTDAGRRDSDNWQKGIPIPEYMKSLLRHVFELWRSHRKGEFNREAADGAFFNLQGFYHEHLKLRAAAGTKAAYVSAGEELEQEIKAAPESVSDAKAREMVADLEKQISAQAERVHDLAFSGTLNSEAPGGVLHVPDMGPAYDLPSGVCEARQPGDFKSRVLYDNKSELPNIEPRKGHVFPMSEADQKAIAEISAQHRADAEAEHDDGERVSPEEYRKVLDKWFQDNLQDDEELVIQKKGTPYEESVLRHQAAKEER